MKKDKCCECKKETTSYINILTGKDWKYESYCLQCARTFFSYISLKPLGKLSLTELNQCSYEWDNLIQSNTNSIKADKKDWSQVPYLMKILMKRKAEGNPISLNDLLKEHKIELNDGGLE
jgi:hypothetical protein